MLAQRSRHRSTSKASYDDRSSGVFELPASARVARRGSTRVEPTAPTEPTPQGRRSLRSDYE